MRAPKGDYELLIQSMAFNDLMKQIRINNQTDNSGISLADDELTIETKRYVPKLLTGDDSKIEMKDTIFNAKSGEEMKIPEPAIPAIKKAVKIDVDLPKNDSVVEIDEELTNANNTPLKDVDPIVDDKRNSIGLKIIGVLFFTGFMIFIIFFFRKRKRNEVSE
jgi:hypothetical protein